MTSIRNAAAATVLLALAAAPMAHAAILYDNFPISGQILNNAVNESIYSISYNYSAADTFTLTAPSTLETANFGVWNMQYSRSWLADWWIYASDASERGIVLGAPLAHGTSVDISANYLFTTEWHPTQWNTWYFDVYEDSIDLGGLALDAGTYWFKLEYVQSEGSSVAYWDVNDGAGQAWRSNAGYGQPSNSFQILGNSTPVAEPASLLMLATGLIGLTVLRRRCLA
jgi:hypothetical protein